MESLLTPLLIISWASSQAVVNANLMCGLDEALGIGQNPLWAILTSDERSSITLAECPANT